MLRPDIINKLTYMPVKYYIILDSIFVQEYYKLKEAPVCQWTYWDDQLVSSIMERHLWRREYYRKYNRILSWKIFMAYFLQWLTITAVVVIWQTGVVSSLICIILSIFGVFATSLLEDCIDKLLENRLSLKELTAAKR